MSTELSVMAKLLAPPKLSSHSPNVLPVPDEVPQEAHAAATDTGAGRLLTGALTRQGDTVEVRINLVDVQDTEIYIEMAGGCQGCAMSRMTLRQGVERMVAQAVPEVTAIHDVTDHSGGENPYFE